MTTASHAKKVGKAFEDQKIWLKGIGRTVVDDRPELGRRGRKLSTSTTTFRAAFHLNLWWWQFYTETEHLISPKTPTSGHLFYPTDHRQVFYHENQLQLDLHRWKVPEAERWGRSRRAAEDWPRMTSSRPSRPGQSEQIVFVKKIV